MRILVSYDISNDKRRRKVAKIMEGNGYRVQYSVFECQLDSRKLNRLQARLRPLVNQKEGESIRFYPLPEDVAERTVVLGKDMRRRLGAVEII